MRSAAVIGLALMASAAIAPTTASAQEGAAPDWADKNGAVGVGGNTTLGGTNGLSVRTYVTPLVGLQLTFGLNLDSATDTVGGEDFTQSQRLIDVGLYATYKLAYWQRGHLSSIFGLDIASASQSFDSGGTETSDSATNILIGLGLHAEFFPTQYLSLYMESGLTVDFLGDGEISGLDMAVPAGSDVSGVDISLRSDLWGAAGFTVWFK